MIKQDNITQVNLNAQINPQLSKSDIFGVLQNNRRRHVLEYLQSNGSQSVRDISEAVACIEAGTDEPVSSVRKSIYVSLLQTHLPKMEKLGILTFNGTGDKVELMPAASDVNLYLETVEEGNISWGQYYLGLSVLAVLGSGAVALGIILWLTTVQWMLFISAMFLLSSLAHVTHMNKVKN